MVKLVKKLKSWRVIADYIKDFLVFHKMSQKANRQIPLLWRDRYPCLGEKTSTTSFDRHYIYHPAWAARILKSTLPDYHVDISSTLHFCSLVSAFVPVSFYDFRPIDLGLTNLVSKTANLTQLDFETDSVQSLSCMHVVEHIGLGRYGDSLDPDGDLKAIAELKRVMAPGGNLLFVVPIGFPRIMFNAHRIYSYEQILNYFSGWKLENFSLVPDQFSDGGLVSNPPEMLIQTQKYGCGCFWLIKR